MRVANPNNRSSLHLHSRRSHLRRHSGKKEGYNPRHYTCRDNLKRQKFTLYNSSENLSNNSRLLVNVFTNLRVDNRRNDESGILNGAVDMFGKASSLSGSELLKIDSNGIRISEINLNGKSVVPFGFESIPNRS